MSQFNKLSRVLVVDDEDSLRHLLVLALEGQGIEVDCASDGVEALERFNPERHDAVLTDIRMPRLDGLAFTRRLLQQHHNAVVVVMSAYGDIEVAMQALEAGAVDYLNKPFQPDEVKLRLMIAIERWRLGAENVRLRAVVEQSSGFEKVANASPAMQRITETLERVAPHRSSVLLSGESGTGKEVLARSIHAASDRSHQSFVAVNCGAIPANLLESEFFGHKRGAFTDAVRDRKGLFEEATGGTLFLDEVGELPLNLQVKLLRALQEGMVRPVGSDREVSVDVRVLAATNRNLEEQVRRGEFREDLFYRLNVFPIQVPPLRQRQEDLEVLVGQQLEQLASASRRNSLSLDPQVWTLFRQHPWPGNIRQLHNVLEAAAVLCSGLVIDSSHLPPNFMTEVAGDATVERLAVGTEDESIDLSIPDATEHIERTFIQRALVRTNGNKTAAAKVLGISPRSLHYKIKEYGF
jgi:two-component system response regulator AtoC